MQFHFAAWMLTRDDSQVSEEHAETGMAHRQEEGSAVPAQTN